MTDIKIMDYPNFDIFYLNDLLPVLYSPIVHVLSDGELSDNEVLNLTQMTEDSLVYIVDNIEHGHDSGRVDGVQGVTNYSHMSDTQLLNFTFRPEYVQIRVWITLF